METFENFRMLVLLTYVLGPLDICFLETIIYRVATHEIVINNIEIEKTIKYHTMDTADINGSCLSSGLLGVLRTPSLSNKKFV